MKVKYMGESFGIEGLTNGNEYEVIAIEDDMIRIIDDSGEDYLYSIVKPCSLENSNKCGRWEIIEDNENKDLEKSNYIQKMIKEYNYTTEQAESMYKQLQKISENSNLSVKEAVKLVKGEYNE